MLGSAGDAECAGIVAIVTSDGAVVVCTGVATADQGTPGLGIGTVGRTGVVARDDVPTRTTTCDGLAEDTAPVVARAGSAAAAPPLVRCGATAGMRMVVGSGTSAVTVATAVVGDKVTGSAESVAEAALGALATAGTGTGAEAAPGTTAPADTAATPDAPAAEAAASAAATSDALIGAIVTGRRNTVKRRFASTPRSFAELRLKRMSSSAAYGTATSTFSLNCRKRV